MHTEAGSEELEQRGKFGMQSTLGGGRPVPIAIISLGIAGSRLRAS